MQVLVAHESLLMSYDEVRESRSPQHVTHLSHVWDLFLAQPWASIDTGTRGRQFNVSSKQHPARILLMKVFGKFLDLHLG